ncbi:MAG: class I SAM-dependent rRNA methyltransferase [Blastocatellia bacterium]|nr:class I SAM-dependent rRNA methyltransferase [Blastocatellia bacterium]
MERTEEAVISPKGAARARAGHVWIYRSDVIKRPRAASGSVVRVTDQRGRFVGMAHFGEESEITLRLLSREDRPVTAAFWRERLAAAMRWREQIAPGAQAYRLAHGEGDSLPGLVIDRYGDCFSIQTLTRGMDALKSMWVELLIEQFSPRLIVERNDVKVRMLERLPMVSTVLHGDPAAAAEFAIDENGIRFLVDLLEGQKTGAFLDQRENRAAAMTYARGRGLDCFSFHGSFALHLARNCDHVTALDISAPAIERAARNAAANEITNVDFVEANVFDRLRDLDEAGERFDTIVLDPPAFAKNRSAVEAALRGYKEINLRALRLLRPGGILITCSCSYHVSEEMFMQMLAEAAADAGRLVQLIEKRAQSRDHPIVLSIPETHYLKCVILRVL